VTGDPRIAARNAVRILSRVEAASSLERMRRVKKSTLERIDTLPRKH
jgi:hypothetical protein